MHTLFLRARVWAPLSFLLLATPLAAGQTDTTKPEEATAPRVSPLVQAVEARIGELQREQGGPTFTLHSLCDGRIRLIAPADHDLQMYLPTQGGASTERVPIEAAFDRLFTWLDADYMLPTEEEARARVLASVSRERPVVLLLVHRLEDRNHFNVRYDEGIILQEVVRASVRPYQHDSCQGVPCSYPGTCGDIYNCRWETHVPLCEFINRTTAQILERRYGALPPAMMGLAELAEVAITGAHYTYRHWGADQEVNLPHSERDGYAQEFQGLLEDAFKKKNERETHMRQLLNWQGGRFDVRSYAFSWGMGEALLGHWREVGRGDQRRTLGDLLCAIGALEEPTSEAVLALLEAHDKKFMTTFRKSISKKDRRETVLLASL